MVTETKTYWSECGQVFLGGGYGWGITSNLQNVCLGKEEDIKKFFDTEQLNSNLTPIQRQVLNGILEYRKEEGIGTTNTRTDNLERAKPMRVTGYRKKNIKHAKARKGASLH